LKIYKSESVWDAALNRIRFIFDEFPNVAVSFSGGKDSTVILNLALMIAKEKGRLPLPVMFVDQEAEWNAVVSYVRSVMSMEDVEPHWLQVPIKLFNATSYNDQWLYCWRDGDNWMRPKEPNSIHENVFGTDRFHGMFKAWTKYTFGDEPFAFLVGVRAEESPNRRAGLTTGATYKHITWGQVMDKKADQYNFNPLYDWSYADVWTAIHRNGWDYCHIYNEFYRYGIAPIKMRISNLHHETAVDQLFYLQELEPDTWDKLQTRLQGINQARQFTRSEMFKVSELPFMFDDWRDYRDYLVDNLITDEYRPRFIKKFADMDQKFKHMDKVEEMYKEQVFSVLSNDWEFVKIANFLGRPQTINFLKFMRGQKIDWSRPERDLKYIKKAFRGRQVNVASG
jgi:predicted phosphoadenosine phosphosulfate sulfurtransferase